MAPTTNAQADNLPKEKKSSKWRLSGLLGSNSKENNNNPKNNPTIQEPVSSADGTLGRSEATGAGNSQLNVSSPDPRSRLQPNDSAYGGSDTTGSTEAVGSISRSQAAAQDAPVVTHVDHTSGKTTVTTTTTTTTTVITTSGDQQKVPAGQEVVVRQDEPQVRSHTPTVELSAGPVPSTGPYPGTGRVQNNSGPDIPPKDKRRSHSPQRMQPLSQSQGPNATNQPHLNHGRVSPVEESSHTNNSAHPTNLPVNFSRRSPRRPSGEFNPQTPDFKYYPPPLMPNGAHQNGANPPAHPNPHPYPHPHAYTQGSEPSRTTRPRPPSMDPAHDRQPLNGYAMASNQQQPPITNDSNKPHGNITNNNENINPNNTADNSSNRPGHRLGIGNTVRDMKVAAAGIHGAGEALRGAFNSGIDRRAGAPPNVIAAEDAVAERGRADYARWKAQRSQNGQNGGGNNATTGSVPPPHNQQHPTQQHQNSQGYQQQYHEQQQQQQQQQRQHYQPVQEFYSADAPNPSNTPGMHPGFQENRNGMNSSDKPVGGGGGMRNLLRKSREGMKA